MRVDAAGNPDFKAKDISNGVKDLKFRTDHFTGTMFPSVNDMSYVDDI